jgi:aspartate-semialdehyde dehydrogenase
MRDKGMGVTIGSLEQEDASTFSFTALSHNAILGAAGGAVLAAELAVQEGFF